MKKVDAMNLKRYLIKNEAFVLNHEEWRISYNPLYNTHDLWREILSTRICPINGKEFYSRLSFTLKLIERWHPTDLLKLIIGKNQQKYDRAILELKSEHPAENRG